MSLSLHGHRPGGNTGVAVLRAHMGKFLLEAPLAKLPPWPLKSSRSLAERSPNLSLGEKMAGAQLEEGLRPRPDPRYLNTWKLARVGRGTDLLEGVLSG